ncbi:MAG: PAS domain S-box protein [Anaerolineae bacterium]|jgi:PAS domain S-box-containing protein|nr:PAS domain S-box protein [Anaerolineae bacterium]MBT7074518.1 PAS domain S-box protein [Anaerolineae bacterium]
MDNLREKFTYIIKKYFFQYILVPIIALIFIAQGWYSVWHQTNIIIERNILAYQQTELEILRTTARSVDQYITHEFEIHGRKEVSEFEQEIFDKFIEPIHLLENGDAWIYAPDYVVFDLSEDFPYEYFGKSMAEIFKVQKVNGASHYEEMTADIAEAREGVGWYIWLPEKGKEIAAWTPVWVGEYVWTIGLATPLSEILESNGAAEQIRALKMNKGIETLVLVIVFFMWLSSSIRQGRGEKALEKSEKRYRNLFDSAPDGVSILDANGTILECSQSTAELYGYARPEELYGKNMQELMSIDSLKTFREKMPQLQKLNSTEGEIQILRPDGSVVDVWRKGIPLASADGKFSGILSYDRDIRRQKKAELELRESEERFSSSFESSNSGMVMTGMDGHFLLVNRAFSKMLGYTRSELKGKGLRDVTHPEDAEKSLVYLRELLQNKIDSFEDKKRYIRKDGSAFWAEIRVSVVRDEEGNLQYFFRHILDISERVRAEAALQKAHVELEDKIEERTAELKESEMRYRSFFENSPISLWEEDYSLVFKYLDSLRDSGIEDLALYFVENPDEIVKCVGLAQILDVNPATLKIYEAKDKEEFLYNLNNVFTEESLEIFREQLISFYKGNFHFDSEGITKTLMGKKNHIHIRVSSLTQSKVLISIIDITERKKTEGKLREQATIDHLTQIFNRRHFFNLAQTVFALKGHWTNIVKY